MKGSSSSIAIPRGPEAKYEFRKLHFHKRPETASPYNTNFVSNVTLLFRFDLWNLPSKTFEFSVDHNCKSVTKCSTFFH